MGRLLLQWGGLLHGTGFLFPALLFRFTLADPGLVEASGAQFLDSALVPGLDLLDGLLLGLLDAVRHEGWSCPYEQGVYHHCVKIQAARPM